MRVRVTYTVTVEDDYRRSIRAWYGKDGLATRAEVKRWLEAYGSSMDDDLALARDKDDWPARWSSPTYLGDGPWGA